MPQPDESAVATDDPNRDALRWIAGTYFLISTDETRLHLNSALFEWNGDRVRMVTTDGHRLSKMDAVLPCKNASATMLILTQKRARAQALV